MSKVNFTLSLINKLLLILAASILISACSESRNSELARALRDYMEDSLNKETTERVLNAVRKGANPNYDYEGLRPIDVAIEQSHLELARILIQRGYKPTDPELMAESVSYQGEDALNIAKLLLKAGANPHGSPEYASPMSRAIEANNLPAIRLLLTHGARLRGKDDEDPFELAARSGHIEILQFLFSTKARPEDNFQLLIAGISSNNPAIVAYLLTNYEDNGQEKDLFQQASYGLLDDAPNSYENAKIIIKQLESKGLKAPPEAFDPVVIGSAMLANIDALSYAISKGASVNATSDKGTTALMTIAAADLTEAIAESYREDTSLELAKRFERIEDKHLAIARILLQKGADPNLADRHGRTAIMYAAKSLQTSLVDVLLAHKADSKAVDKVGKTAHDYAIQSRPKSPDERDKIANLLASAFGFTPELIDELQRRSDMIAKKLASD